MKRWWFATALALIISTVAIPAQPAAAQDIVWVRQFGTAGTDIAGGVAVDAAGNAYVAGVTAGTLAGQASAGGEDAFLRKFDRSGTELWTRQFGTAGTAEGFGVTAGTDAANGVAVDAAGNAYVAGLTTGTFAGQTSAGGVDAFLAKIGVTGP